MIFLRITNKPSCFLQSGFKKDKLMKVEDYKMRILFEMDKKDYVPDGSVYSRPSARAVIIKDGKIAMVYSKKHHFTTL